MYAVTPNKVEQQRRYAARADTTITEPRFDPRRRKSGMLSPEQTPAASSNLGVSQPRASAASAASRLSYTPDRSNGVQSSQSSGSSQGAQPKGPLSQGTSGQPSAELAAWQSEGRRGTEQSGNSEVSEFSPFFYIMYKQMRPVDDMDSIAHCRGHATETGNPGSC